VTLQTERRRLAPYGLNDGRAGQPGRNVILRHEGSGDGGPEPRFGETSRPARPEALVGPAADQRSDGHQRRPTELPSKIRLTVSPGDRLTIETPGGGGWGKPR
jgi:N-methylhydantoinase B/oxoprolinase/acetone carboxylase alpha subunit